MAVTWSALISWTGGSLDLHDPLGGYRLVNWSSGTLTYRRDEADPSQFVHGVLYTAHVKDEATRTMTVRVQGASLTEWVARRDALFAAVSNVNYTITITANGVTIETWNYCQPAQIEIAGIGGSGDGASQFGFDAPQPQQEYALEIPSSPV